MSDNKERKVEWSFSFDEIADSIGRTLESMGVSVDTEVKTEQFHTPLGDAASASVKLDMAMGETVVGALKDSENLLEADVVYVGEVRLESKEDGPHKQAHLGTTKKANIAMKSIKDLFSRGDHKRLSWNVRLTPSIPLDLEINTGVTQNRLDFSRLQLTKLRVKCGTGKTELAVPAMASQYPVRFDGGMGECRIDIPPEANIDLKVNSGTGATRISVGVHANLNAAISGGMGECIIEVPEGAAVLLKASTGIGSIKVPGHLARIKGGERFIATDGTWQTPDYDMAERKITIRYSGGVGQLTIKTATPDIV